MYRKNNSKQRRILVGLILLQILAAVLVGRFFGDVLWKTIRTNLLLRLYNGVVELCMPQIAYEEERISEDVMGMVLPSYYYHGRQMKYESQTEGQADYIALAEKENASLEAMLAENEIALADLENGAEGTAATKDDGEVTSDNAGKTSDSEDGDTAEEAEDAKGDKAASAEIAATPEKQVQINRQKLTDFDYLRQTFYQVDSSTTIGKDQLNIDALLEKDMTLKDTEGDAPQILIYHTHSQEGYKDSVEGDPSTTVVGLGNYLTTLLTEQYGYKVLHHTGEYDVGDRDHAYTNAAPALEKLLEENPTIQVIIDLHRDGVADTTHLVTEINGKPTAQIMFFNGLSRTTKIGDISWLPNSYIADNLSFSFQLQLAAAEYYPGLTRRIYLKGYRYNMHYRPQSLLVEVGAQTNTLEEAMNAMEPLAVILHEVLSGE